MVTGDMVLVRDYLVANLSALEALEALADSPMRD